MAQIILTVNDAKVPDFQAARARWNQENGKNLSAENWIKYLVAIEVYRDQIRDNEQNKRLAAERTLRGTIDTDKENIVNSL